MWNFFANPDTSTRNLFLNIGFVGWIDKNYNRFNVALLQAVGAHILWIIPTFLGTLPNNRAEEQVLESSIERVGGLPSNVAAADPVTLWNRLLCPQCILQIVGINSINVSRSSVITGFKVIILILFNTCKTRVDQYLILPVMTYRFQNKSGLRFNYYYECNEMARSIMSSFLLFYQIWSFQQIFF